MTDLLLIIPTRKINDIVFRNVSIIKLTENSDLAIRIVIVSNDKSDVSLSKDFDICFCGISNKALMLNTILHRFNTFKYHLVCFLDDDIELTNDGFRSLMEWRNKLPEKCIFSPYDSQNCVRINKKFGNFHSFVFSKLFNRKIKSYFDIQGKSFFCCWNFTPLRKESLNNVEWIPGTFMLFKNFNLDELYFDKDIFCDCFYMEDYWLSHRLFLMGIPIFFVPESFEHNHSKKTEKKSYYERKWELVKLLTMQRRMYTSFFSDSHITKFHIANFVRCLIIALRDRMNFGAVMSAYFLVLLSKNIDLKNK